MARLLGAWTGFLALADGEEVLSDPVIDDNWLVFCVAAKGATRIQVYSHEWNVRPILRLEVFELGYGERIRDLTL